MEVDVRDGTPRIVDVIRFSDTLCLYGTAQEASIEIRVDGQPAGSGVTFPKAEMTSLIRALNLANRVW